MANPFKSDSRSSSTSKVNSYNVGASDYSKHEIQPWDIVAMYNLDFFEGNILKYLLRKKGSRIEDLNKIKHYVDKYLEILSKDDTGSDSTDNEAC